MLSLMDITNKFATWFYPLILLVIIVYESFGYSNPCKHLFLKILFILLQQLFSCSFHPQFYILLHTLPSPYSIQRGLMKSIPGINSLAARWTKQSCKLKAVRDMWEGVQCKAIRPGGLCG